MEWTDIQITVATENLDAAAAIAQLAVPYGIHIEDYSDLLEQAPRIAHLDLIDEDLLARPRDKGVIHLYISPQQPAGEAVSWMTERLRDAGIPFTLDNNTLSEEDWATAWKQFYHPTPIGKRLVVCPTWEDYTPREGQLVLRLDPGMAFGTGTHATTRLCCSLLEETVTPGCRLLDLGAGSGILSIAALKLGAACAVGADIDPVAGRTAQENAALNGFLVQQGVPAGPFFTLEDDIDNLERTGFGPGLFFDVAADLLEDDYMVWKLGSGYHLVTANIVADAIIALAPVFPKKLRPGGKVICSGVILPRKEEVVAALEERDLVILRVEELDGWCAILAALPEDYQGDPPDAPHPLGPYAPLFGGTV